MAIAKCGGMFLLLITLLVFLSGCKGGDMLLQGEKVCLFSSMEGQLTFQGEPVKGAKIVRKIAVNDKKEEPSFVTTDEKGMFSFSVVNKVIRQIFPAEIVTVQSLFVHYQGQEYHVWHMARRDGGEYEEFGGKPVNLRCEITDEIVPVEIKRGLLVTSCIWDSIEEVAYK